MVKKTFKKNNFRSGLEEAVAKELDKLNVDYGYEDTVIPYEKPARKTRYTPDFRIKINGALWETKGRFQTSDRKKHLLIKEQHEVIIGGEGRSLDLLKKEFPLGGDPNSANFEWTDINNQSKCGFEDFNHLRDITLTKFSPFFKFLFFLKNMKFFEKV